VFGLAVRNVTPFGLSTARHMPQDFINIRRECQWRLPWLAANCKADSTVNRSCPSAGYDAASSENGLAILVTAPGTQGRRAAADLAVLGGA
jgi:hypothetical protein